jgi:hypothetical protein
VCWCGGREVVSGRFALANFTRRAAVIVKLVKVKASNDAKNVVCSNSAVCVCSIYAPLDVISVSVYSNHIC